FAASASGSKRRDGFGHACCPGRLFGQDFRQLKEFCVGRRLKFIDDMFPPDSKSIGQGVLSPSDLARVVWLRPAVSGFGLELLRTRPSSCKGSPGNCWFLASIGALTFQDQILQQVVPQEQDFDENYCGLFHFRFWRFGKWVDVVIDDKLPTINGSLIFVHSKKQNEFWPALLEKAYAKVCGSYTDMNAGTPAEAMMDFTGGVHMSIQLSDPPPDLWGLMSRAGNFSALLSCSTPQGSSSLTLSPNGLVQGHAYTVTGVVQPVKMLRLWNPWGKGEWNGDWSDRSQDREKCLSVVDDGEFWMTLEDFSKFFTDLDICGLNPNFLDEDSSSQWTTSVAEGRWVAGTTAGGCMNYKGNRLQLLQKIPKCFKQCKQSFQ
uniref:Calpain catalytic domain-containing protein n=1 Tax=Xiphophorus couchianus TaxID=32473 RepID=A0A3B5M2F7_9TELE